MIRSVRIFLVCLFAAGSMLAQAQNMGPVLQSATAKTIAEACEKLAGDNAWNIAVAVVDQGGNLKYFHRMDGTSQITVELARLKAETSARMPMATADLAELAKTMPGVELMPGVTVTPGGLPILTGDDSHLGGVGVSGATGEQDIACARAGLDAAADLLE